MKANKLIYFFVFLLLVLSSFVLAVPQSNVNTGLQISFPPFDYGLVNTAFEMPFHVYSLESGLAVNTNVNCTLHIYDAMGDHLFISSNTAPSHDFDYEFVINDSVFSSTGSYAFNTYCECVGCGDGGVDLGGFVKHIFEINSNGRENVFGGWLMFILTFLVVASTFGFGTLSYLLKSVSKRENSLYSLKLMSLLLFISNILFLGLFPLLFINFFTDVFGLSTFFIGYASVDVIIIMIFSYFYFAGWLEGIVNRWFGGGV